MTFKGTNSLFEFSTTEVLDINLKFWLDWSFLNIGGFDNMNIPASGAYNGDMSRLIPVRDRDYTNGQVWKAPRSNWVWESGLSYESQPTQVSGAYVNNVFSTALKVDYPNGRVIFDSPVSTNSVVQANYSSRMIHIYSASESDFFNDLQGDSYRVDRHGYGIGSGEYDYERIQTPAIIYESFARTFNPYQLGGNQYSEQQILFHIITEDRNTANKLSDIIAEQNEKTIFLFDPEYLKDSGTFPLDYRGGLNDGALTYNQLIIPKEDGGYRWRKLRLYDSNKQSTTKLQNNMFHTPIKFKTDLVLTDI